MFKHFFRKKSKETYGKPKKLIEAASLNAEAMQPLDFSSRLLSFHAANMQGTGNRERQEDSFAFVNALNVGEMKRRGLFAVVADGMGGMDDGKMASATVVSSLTENFRQTALSEHPVNDLCDMLDKVGCRVYEALQGRGGSTAVACLFYGGYLYYAGVGDSSFYLMRNGSLLRISREQNVKNDILLETIRSGSLDSTSAMEAPDKDALAQFLGMEDIIQPDMLRRPLKLHDQDYILVCTDGITDTLSDVEIKACFQEQTPDAVCSALEEAVFLANRPCQDNYTALVIQCGY